MLSHPTLLELAFVAAAGLAAGGCQSMAIAMDDPLAYDPDTAQYASFNPYCSTMARDATVRGRLPSPWCAPYGPSPYWSRPVPGYSFYGWGSRLPWRGSPGYYSRGHAGRYGGFRSGGFRSGRGRR